MTKILQAPEFTSEAEEAEWWANHQDFLVQEFKQAAVNGSLNRRGQTPTTTLRLDPVT